MLFLFVSILSKYPLTLLSENAQKLVRRFSHVSFFYVVRRILGPSMNIVAP